MSDFCSTFAQDFRENMKKTYIQPEIETKGLNALSSVMQLVLGSPTAPEPHITPAPKRRDQVF